MRLSRVINAVKVLSKTPNDLGRFVFGRNAKTNGIILISHESLRHGAEYLLLHIAEELVKQGENIYIISRQVGPMNREFTKCAPVQIVPTDAMYVKAIRKLRDQYEYKRMILNTAICGNWTKPAKDCGYSVVSLIHELPGVLEELSAVESARSMIRYSDSVIFSSEEIRKRDLEYLKEPDNSRIHIKAQGVYFKKPTPMECQAASKKIIENYKIATDRKIVIFIAGTCKRKGFDIFAEVARQMPEYLFVQAGELTETYYEMKGTLPSNLICIGELDSTMLSGLYELADLLLLASREDPLPSVVFESLVFGKPVVGSCTSGGIRDIINGKNGILTDETTAEAFAEAVRKVMDQLEAMKRYIIENVHYENSFSDYVSYLIKCFDS